MVNGQSGQSCSPPLGTYINLHAFLTNPDKALMCYKDPLEQKQLSIFSNQIRGLSLNIQQASPHPISISKIKILVH